MYKRGYKDGEKTVEIIEGNVDVVIYHEKGNTFYYYRFAPSDVFSESISSRIYRSTNILFRDGMEKFLRSHGIDYEDKVNELIALAIESGMQERYDM